MASSPDPADVEPPKLTGLGRLAILLFVVACLYGAWRLFVQKPAGRAGGSPAAAGAPAPAGRAADDPVAIGIAYGTEKERWLQWAAARFAETADGKRIKLDLIPMGSLEGAQAILAGDRRIQVWSPASALYRDIFVGEWQVKHGSAKPILRGEALALTPMVFVTWAERHDAFVARYGKLTLKTIARALAEPSGWQAIAGKPEWGLFKFGHTHPNQSNSGLATLVLMAYEFHGKSRGLALQDILDPGYQEWATGLERAVTGLSNSTGNMMREMVLKGPSAYDSLFVYESVAIDYLKNAEGRWGELRVDYPERNLWNDNPYYVLDVPWSSAEQRQAAASFLDFLLSEPIQKQSLVHGFRPGNPAVAVRGPDSPFTLYRRFGLAVDLGAVCEPPRAEVINNLLEGWQRAHG
jgi:ABC-type Fe3+ transport system substrate-binding protein